MTVVPQLEKGVTISATMLHCIICTGIYIPLHLNNLVFTFLLSFPGLEYCVVVYNKKEIIVEAPMMRVAVVAADVVVIILDNQIVVVDAADGDSEFDVAEGICPSMQGSAPARYPLVSLSNKPPTSSHVTPKHS